MTNSSRGRLRASAIRAPQYCRSGRAWDIVALKFRMSLVQQTGSASSRQIDQFAPLFNPRRKALPSRSTIPIPRSRRGATLQAAVASASDTGRRRVDARSNSRHSVATVRASPAKRPPAASRPQSSRHSSTLRAPAGQEPYSWPSRPIAQRDQAPCQAQSVRSNPFRRARR